MSYAFICDRHNYLRHYGPLLTCLQARGRRIVLIEVCHRDDKISSLYSLADVIALHSRLLEWNIDCFSIRRLNHDQLRDYIVSTSTRLIFSLIGFSKYSIYNQHLRYSKWIVVHHPDILAINQLSTNEASYWLSYEETAFRLHSDFLSSSKAYDYIRPVFLKLQNQRCDFQLGLDYIYQLFPQILKQRNSCMRIAIIYYGDLLASYIGPNTSFWDKSWVRIYQIVFQNRRPLIRRLLSSVAIVTEESLLIDMYAELKSNGYLVILKTRDKRPLLASSRPFFDIVIDEVFYYPILSDILTHISDLVIGFASTTICQASQNNKTSICLLPIHSFQQFCNGIGYCEYFEAFLTRLTGIRIKRSYIYNIPLVFSRRLVRRLPLA